MWSRSRDQAPMSSSVRWKLDHLDESRYRPFDEDPPPDEASTIRWRSCDRDSSTCVAKIMNDRGHPMKIVRSRAVHGEKKIGPSDLIRIQCVRMIHDDLPVMKIGRFRHFHVSSGKSVDRVHLCFFLARVLIDDRVDSGPRDR